MISYLGKQLDAAQEHELIKKSPGFCVEVVFGPKYGNKTSVFHNITEVHWIYPDSITGDRVALESDVHSTGFTYDINDIVSINITIEEKELANV